MTQAEELGFNDPTAQRLQRITTGADAEIVTPPGGRLVSL